MALVVFLLRMGRFRDHDGRVFFAAMSLWALTRVAAAFTWRDPVVVGPFGAAQVLGIAIALVYFALFVLRAMYTSRTIRAIRAARARDQLPAVVPAARGGHAATTRCARRVGSPTGPGRKACRGRDLRSRLVLGGDVMAVRAGLAGASEAGPSAEAAVKLPAPATVPGAPLVIRSVIVEPVAAEPVVGAAMRAAEVVEVAVAGPATAPIEAGSAPIQPAPVEPVHLVPVIASPSPAVPIWQEIEHERLAPAEIVATSEQVLSEHGQPRHRTARELLAMAEAVRLAEAERVGRSARVRMPPAVAIPAPLAGRGCRRRPPRSRNPSRRRRRPRCSWSGSRPRSTAPLGVVRRRPTRPEDQSLHAAGRREGRRSQSNGSKRRRRARRP